MHRIYYWLRNFCALLGLLLLLITLTPVLKLWIAALSTGWGEEAGDTLIVLGQETTAPDMLGLGSYWRTYYAAVLWHRNGYKQVIVTGREAAPLMRDLMVNQGIPRDSIRVENRANSTRENALFVAEMLRGNTGTKVLLTSDYHTGRAWRAFRAAGVETNPLPFPDANKRVNDIRERWTVFVTVMDETARALWYRAHGWT